MRNIEIGFYKDHVKQIYSIPCDESTRRQVAYYTEVDELDHLNINPKELVCFQLSGYIQEEMLSKLKGIDEIYLQFYNEKNKFIKLLISKELTTK